MVKAKTHQAPEWVPTSKAALALGISPCTLKRYANRDGILEEGTHYRRGPHANTALLWHLERCFEAVRGNTRQ